MKKETPYCWIMVALPGVGKSTYIDQVMSNRGIDFKHLSTDALIEEAAKARGLTYSDVFKEEIDSATKRFFEQIEICTREKFNIIIDRTNLTVKSRKRILDLIPNDYRKVAIVLEVDEATHKERLNRPGKFIPSYVIENMRKTFEFPTEAEGFYSITHIIDVKDERFYQ